MKSWRLDHKDYKVDDGDDDDDDDYGDDDDEFHIRGFIACQNRPH